MGSTLDALKKKRATIPPKARAPPKRPATKEVPKGSTLRRLRMQRKPPEPPEYFTIGKEYKEGVPGTSPIADHLPKPASRAAAKRQLEDAERCYKQARLHLIDSAIDPEAPLEQYLEARLRLRRMRQGLDEARSNLKRSKKG